jgi:hypothetical protein
MNRKMSSSRCRREEAEQPVGASNSQIHTGPILSAEQGPNRNVLSSQFLRQCYPQEPEEKKKFEISIFVLSFLQSSF